MKKFISILSCTLICALFTVSAYAAEKQDKCQNEKPKHVAGFISNGFWDNWELQGGVGPTFNLGAGFQSADAVYVGGYLAVGKWFHPIFGVRVTGEGGRWGQKTANWSYIHIHPDFMVNLSNWIGGYKQRVYNAVLYAGAGLGVGALNTPDLRTYEFLANIGLQNRFRVCDAVSIDIQVQYDLGKGGFRPVAIDKSAHFHGLTAMAGFTVNFNKRTFERSGATEEQAKAALEQLNRHKAAEQKALAEKELAEKQAADRQAELEAVKQALTDAQNQAEELAKLVEDQKAQAETAKEAVSTDNYDEMIFYSYGYGVLTDTAKKRLDLIAEHIKNSKKPVFKIDGFSDPETGSKSCNVRLAEKRARLVYEYLLSKGVPAERMEYRNCGTQNCPFGKPRHNRIVVIY